MDRDVLTDAQWEYIRDLLPGREKMLQSSSQGITGSAETTPLQIAECINKDKTSHQNKALPLSVPGTGEVSAQILLTHLPALGKVSHKTIASLVDVAPYARQSGHYQEEEHIGGGRREVRCVLYMAILSAIRHNPI